MKRLFVLLGLLLMVSAVHADALSIIQLENRPAEEVIAVIEPMLGPDDSISGQGFKIFLQSSPETRARIESMIEVLDAPAKILRVSVFQGSEQDLRRIAASANVQIESGSATIEIGEGRETDDSAGGSITYSTSGGSASVDGISTQQSLRGNPIHQVRVTEGTEAYIETGERIPYFSGAAWAGRRGFAGSVEYKDATTGFYVLPRVRGENCVLEVSPFKSSYRDSGPDNFDTQSASTTITGRIGQWLLIGGVVEQVGRTESSTGTTYATQGSGNTGIWIKADVVE